MLRIVSVVSICILFSIISYAQTNITGQVKDINNKPLEKVTVKIINNSKVTLTDEQGVFSFNDLPAGKYTLQFTSTGFESFRKTVNSGSTHEITLLPSSEQLQTVEITGRKESGYKNTNSFIGSKTATALKDVPQSISYVTKEVMQDQGAVRMGDVVKNLSGVNQFTFYDDLTIRGFRINGGSTTQLMNGMRTFTGFWKQPMVNYLERVEVIKGPASALFGNASPGGAINRVTKKPLEEARKSLSFTMGSFNNNRALADFTGPLNDEKTILYRLNLGYENAESFRDLQFDKNLVIAPSVSFLPTEKTRINFDAVYNKSNSRLDRGQSVIGNDLYSTPTSLALSASNDYLNEETYTVMASLNHQFNSRLAFNLAYLRTGYSQDLLEHRSANGYAVDMDSVIVPNLVARQAFIRKSKQYSDNASAYLTYDAHTGKIEHKLMAGFDYTQATLPPGSAQQTANNYLLKTGASKAYNPKKSADYQTYQYTTPDGKVLTLPKPNVSSFDLTRKNNQLEDVSKYVFGNAANSATVPTFSSLYGVYVQDQIKLGNLQVLLGLRFDTYKDKANYKTDSQEVVSQHKVLPRIGLVYSLTPNINVYGIYTQGYNPQDAATQANPLSGGPFSPIESNLIEGGLKTEWFNSQLTANLSVYQIRQKGTLYTASAPEQPELMIQIGEERARGVELDVTGQITSNWNITLNYAYNDATITEADSKNQIYVGKQKPNAPKHQGNLWTKYIIPAGPAKGLGIGAGGNFVDSRNVSNNATQVIPGYAIFNGALFYKVNKVQLQLNFNNLTNKTYWVGGYDYIRLFPGAPRSWQATISYTF
ncbi:iron complex outermembrane recepter protein [Chitinophaga sp. CF118]|uniref:TonB-dependent receptor n=1 Tax=Chitinophaga sp. CF118 TaxID=1884367 RepID=UPI0008E775E7|nr:TonB-dependent receptor [Chitinophaga sp. CF118]SFD25253.1 iron complex outermembrane recepter protein [Chitinophaga sp. CF118]